jgi:hypothetical protein
LSVVSVVDENDGEEKERVFTGTAFADVDVVFIVMVAFASVLLQTLLPPEMLLLRLPAQAPSILGARGIKSVALERYLMRTFFFYIPLDFSVFFSLF